MVKTLSFHCREQVSGHGTKIPPAVQPLKKKKKIYIYIYLASAVVGALWYNYFLLQTRARDNAFLPRGSHPLDSSQRWKAREHNLGMYLYSVF